MEKILHIRLYHYLNDHNILVDGQFGFKENSSTDIATYAPLNTVLLSLEKKKL